MGMREVVFVLFLSAAAWSVEEALESVSLPNHLYIKAKCNRVMAGIWGQSS